MIVKVDLPDELVNELYRGSGENNLTPDQYASEMLYQLLAERSLGKDAELENRPDWQAGLERSQAERAAGRVVPHREVVDWHEYRRE
jgi:predicted transcriptional regulator